MYFRFRYLTHVEIEFLQSVRVQASRGLSLGCIATRTQTMERYQALVIARQMITDPVVFVFTHGTCYV